MAKSRKNKFSEFMSLVSPKEDSKLLDIGPENKECSPYANYLEKHYPFPQKNITALSIQPLDLFEKRYGEVKIHLYDGGTFPFNDKSFDIVYSNAVIEHVGPYEQKLEFFREMLRVGKQVYFATPDRWFPVEMHTHVVLLHWLPKSFFDRYLRFVGKSFWASDYLVLMSKSDVKKLLRDSDAESATTIRHKLMGVIPMDIVVYTGEGL